ncbi:F187B protein, partial [Polyodon spathula]|nr:F187B protein [Polyodon spathula]
MWSNKGLVINVKDPRLLNLQSRAVMRFGDLKLQNPKIKDSGGYICKGEQETLVHYKVEIQEVYELHISHAGLGQKVRSNLTKDLGDGRQMEVFTHWNSWQACDRCGSEGERKRVGFCYGRVTQHSVPVWDALPCGLMRIRLEALGKEFTGFGPELRIEFCNVTCSDAESGAFLQEMGLNFVEKHQVQTNHDASLTCPGASLYSPLYWMKDSHPVTHLELLKQDDRHSLDRATAGGTYRISQVMVNDSGKYLCYVSRTLTKGYQLEVQVHKQEAEYRDVFNMDVFIVLTVTAFLFLLVGLVKYYYRDVSEGCAKHTEMTADEKTTYEMKEAECLME